MKNLSLDDASARSPGSGGKGAGTRTLGGVSFLKKELSEIRRSYKIYVVPVVFIFFGFLSPLFAKIMPDLVKSMAGKQGGIQVILPPPTWIDAFLQFFQNLNQIGLLAVILTTAGTIADEKARGTAALILTKPLSRTSFVLAKFGASMSVLIVAVLLGYSACLYYTMILFPGAVPGASAAATLSYLLFASFMVSVSLWASALARSSVAAGGITLGGFFIFSLLPSLSSVLARYSPGTLLRSEMALLNGTATLSEIAGAAGVTVALGGAFLAWAVLIFSRQEL